MSHSWEDLLEEGESGEAPSDAPRPALEDIPALATLLAERQGLEARMSQLAGGATPARTAGALGSAARQETRNLERQWEARLEARRETRRQAGERAPTELRREAQGDLRRLAGESRFRRNPDDRGDLGIEVGLRNTARRGPGRREGGGNPDLGIELGLRDGERAGRDAEPTARTGLSKFAQRTGLTDLAARGLREARTEVERRVPALRGLGALGKPEDVIGAVRDIKDGARALRELNDSPDMDEDEARLARVQKAQGALNLLQERGKIVIGRARAAKQVAQKRRPPKPRPPRVPGVREPTLRPLKEPAPRPLPALGKALRSVANDEQVRAVAKRVVEEIVDKRGKTTPDERRDQRLAAKDRRLEDRDRRMEARDQRSGERDARRDDGGMAARDRRRAEKRDKRGRDV